MKTKQKYIFLEITTKYPQTKANNKKKHKQYNKPLTVQKRTDYTEVKKNETIFNFIILTKFGSLTE